MKKPILILLLVLAIFTGCKKSAPEPEVPLTGKWLLKSSIFSSGKSFQQYTNNEYYSFDVNGQVTLVMRSIIWNASYTYNKAEQKIVISDNSTQQLFVDHYSILKLTADSLKLKNTASTSNGQSLQITDQQIFSFARK